jgi:hypothetical protein
VRVRTIRVSAFVPVMLRQYRSLVHP